MTTATAASARGFTSPPTVVGIDPSLTKTGVGIVTATSAHGVQLTHRRPVEKRLRAKAGLPESPSLAERDECISAAVIDVLDVVGQPSLVVVYDPPAGAKAAGATRLDVPGAWWAIVRSLLRVGLPVARLMDVSARKAITGPRPKGESRESVKLATGLAVAKLWPDVEIVSDDVADALAAAHLGAVALGLDVPTLARHHDVKWSEWPALPDPAAMGGAA